MARDGAVVAEAGRYVPVPSERWRRWLTTIFTLPRRRAPWVVPDVWARLARHERPLVLLKERHWLWPLHAPSAEAAGDRARCFLPQLPVVRLRRRLMGTLRLPDPCGWFSQTCDRDEPGCGSRYANPLDLPRRWFKAMLCGFEETVLRLHAGKIRAHDEERLLALVGPLGLFAGLGLALAPPPGDPDHLVARALRWRCMMAALARQCWWPSARTGDPHWDDLVVQYELTHLDLVTHVAERQYQGLPVDDTYWTTPSKDGHSPLTVVYPLPNRVLCAHELPDLQHLLLEAGLWMDVGKSRVVGDLAHELIRNLIFKLGPRICYIRHIPKTPFDKKNQWQESKLLVLQILEMALLGAFPDLARRHASPALDGWAQRVRVHKAFEPGVMTKARMDVWCRQNRYVYMFLMRQWFFYLLAATGVVEERLYAGSRDWIDFKDLSRAAVLEIRLALESEARAGGIAAPFDWSRISPPESRHGEAPMTTAQKSTRIIGALHTYSIRTFRKLNKGMVRDVMLRKMVAVKGLVVWSHLKQWVQRTPWVQTVYESLLVDDREGRRRLEAAASAAGQWDFVAYLRQEQPPQPDTVFSTELAKLDASLAAFYLLRPLAQELEEGGIRRLITWAARAIVDDMGTRRHQHAFALRYLQMLGMTEDGFQEVQTWLTRLLFYQLPDDRLRSYMAVFGFRSLRDFVLLESYLRAIKHALREHTVMLPAEQYLMQAHRLRRRLQLTSYEASPWSLGRALWCDGCHAFATVSQPPPSWILCAYDRELMARQRDRLRRAGEKQQHQVTTQRKQRRGPSSRTILGEVLQQHQQQRPPKRSTELLLSDEAYQPVGLGQSRHLLDLTTGERYCPNVPTSKTMAQAQRLRSYVDHHPDGAGDGAEAEVEEVDEVLEARTTVAREEAQFYRTQFQREDSDDSDDDEDEEDGDEEQEESLPLTKAKAASVPTSLPAHMKARWQPLGKYLYNNLLHDPASVPPTAVGTAGGRRRNCTKVPLVDVDMLGVLYSWATATYGLCVHCGDLVRATAHKWTNAGLSCMNHPHVDQFPWDHIHTQCFAAQTNANAQHRLGLPMGSHASRLWPTTLLQHDYLKRRLQPHPQILGRRVVPCEWCWRASGRVEPTVKVIQIFNADTLRTREVALCDYDLRTLHSRATFADLGLVEIGRATGARVLPLIDETPLEHEYERLLVTKRRHDQSSSLTEAVDEMEALPFELDLVAEEDHHVLPPPAPTMAQLSEAEELRALEVRLARARPAELAYVLRDDRDLAAQYDMRDLLSPSARRGLFAVIVERMDGLFDPGQ